jgi:hypothetical protein
MPFLFCAHKAEQFDSGGVWTNSSTAGTFDSSYTNTSIAVPIGTNASKAHSIAFGSGTETNIWIHMYLVNATNSNNEDGQWVEAVGDTGEVIAGITNAFSASQQRMFYSANGTSRTQSGATYSSSNTAVTYDINIKFNDAASGNITIALYINGTIHDTTQTVAIGSNGSTGIAAVTWGGSDHMGFNMSEVIIADEDTRGMRLGYMVPDGAGNHTAWDGVPTDIGFNKEFQGIT